MTESSSHEPENVDEEDEDDNDRIPDDSDANEENVIAVEEKEETCQVRRTKKRRIVSPEFSRSHFLYHVRRGLHVFFFTLGPYYIHVSNVLFSSFPFSFRYI